MAKFSIFSILAVILWAPFRPAYSETKLKEYPILHLSEDKNVSSLSDEGRAFKFDPSTSVPTQIGID